MRRDRSVLSTVFLLLALALLPVAQAAAAGLRLHMWPTPPIYTGTSYSLGVLFEKEDRNDGIDHQAPFTYRITLPAGMRYQSSNGSAWVCNAEPNLRDVTCIYSTSLNFWNPSSSSLSINATTDYGLTPAPVTLTGTIASAQVPLPPTPNCMPQPSLTGCATANTSIVTSKVQITGWSPSNSPVTTGQVAVWTGAAFEPGVQQILVIETNNIGFGQVNTPVTIDVWLPAGIRYDNQVGGLLVWNCQMQSTPGHLRCTTAYMFDGLNAFMTLRVTAENNVAIPGPLYVHAAIGNNVQPMPTTCVADPTQFACARLQIPTRPPRVATLVTDGVSHSPAVFNLGEQGTLLIGYRNIGEASAGTSNVYVQLPPHFEYLGMLGALPAASCTAQGALATGQVLTCQSQGLPPSSQGFMNLRLFGHAQAASPGPLPVRVAVDLTTPANPTPLLQSCATNPAQSFCAADAIPTYFRCALQWADGIFCDGIEVFVRP